MMQITVDLGERSYPIIIEHACLTSNYLKELLVGRKICVVTNETVGPLYLNDLLTALPHEPACIVELPDGEQFKHMASIEKIFDAALENKLNRKSVMIALGGGVIGDMTGFAAACYQRGIDFVQVPTTVLSQVDSSVGGKTGVNHLLGKNMIGAFHQPIAVLIDTNTLKTLPNRELAAGIAEIIKYGLIVDDGFFEWLEVNIEALNDKDDDALTYAIKRSCELKAQIVAEDEKENGIRAILNLGHTFGHAIEAKMGYGQWLHGEAVAVGMVMAVDLSVRMGLLDAEILKRTCHLLEAANLPLVAPTEMTVEDFLAAMAVDKKNIDDRIRLVLLEKLGKACISDDHDMSLMKLVIEENIA
ncbi:MAG: 3-dehydroquinate synthase [Pseudomonadales bacterium]|nr:3-dehydroquinate synthase [Pseudomonadales bacterium]